MKILFCNNNLSGMLLFRKEVMQYFISKGYEVVIVVPKDNNNILNNLPKEIKCLFVKMNRTSTNPFKDVLYFIGLLRVFYKEKPNYIFNYTIKPNIYGSIASKILGIPCSSMMAGLGYTFTNNKLSSIIARNLYKLGILFSQHLLLLNQESFDIIKNRNMCPERKLMFLPGGEGVDLEYYSYSDNYSDVVKFLFIARLIEEKGYNEFVGAAKIVKTTYPNVLFQVIGRFDTNYPKAISKVQVDKDYADGYIEYLGTTTNMMQYYKEPGYVICIPSYYSEGLNRSLMEGCATGKPIITTDHPGCRETVDDGENGFVVPPRNVEALAAAMIKYINLSKEGKERMSIKSRCLAEHRFDVNAVIKVYDDIINKSLQN